MIQQFVNRFMENKSRLEEEFRSKHPGGYEEIVKSVVKTITTGEYDDIDPERITVINHGDYQGTLLFIIGSKEYQPRNYWSLFVDYGSCSGCDTYESIRSYSDEKPTEEQVSQYMTLALHIVQGLRKINED